MATRKLTEVDITNTVMDSDTLLTVRGNLVQRVKKSDLTRGFISQEDLAVERARIDNLLKLEEGSTTGDAELQDLRVGIDGTEYESAGTAVRTQIENLAAIVEEGGLNLDELVLSVNKDANKATIYMSDGKVEKTADIPMPVDSVLLIDSPNPVQNMVIATEINTILEEIDILKNEGIGGETGTTIRLTNQNGTATLISSYGSAAILMFTFTSTQDDLPSGNGNCKISVNGIQKLNVSIPQGLNSIDVSPYLTIGSNSVVVTCTDVFGKSRSLAYDITVVQLTIESTFDASVPYSGDITFKYTPYGSIDKLIHFVIDGEEQGNPVKTSLSGKQMTRTISAMSHGTHKLEVYSTASMEESQLESPKLTYDIMCLEEGNTTPMIASAYTVETVSQGELISIPYIVYDPTKLACDITLTIYTMESGERVVYNTQEITVDRSRKYWNTRKYPLGNVYFEIKYGDTIPPKTHCVVVEENKIKIEAETNDLELLLLSEGRSNDELNPAIWSYGDVTTTFSNMNWGSVGWINDENGDTCLRLNGDARAEIQFKPFAEDLRTYGKTLELEFVVRDVNNRDATVISCMSGGLGFEVKPDTACLVSEQSKVFCNYKDEERVRLAFVIESKAEYRLLSIYLNGVLSDVVQYPTTDNFQQKEPVSISIGSSDCGVDLYVVRSYTTALPSHSIITNYIADMTNIARKTEIYEANDIYDDYGKISFEKAKAKNSVMVIVGALPQSKGDKKTGKVVYYDIEDANLNFEDTMIIDVQGTSSQFYVRKNWKLKFDNPHLIDTDQLAGSVICIKVDYAEATGTHNTQNAVLVEKLYSEKIPPQEVDPKVRTTIYGKPILLFHQQTTGDTPVFYGKANFNFDKGAENVFGFTDKYDVECWEFCNNTSDACNFLGEIPEVWKDDFEARYPDGCKDISRFKTMHDWVVSTKGDVDKFKAEFEQYFDLHYSLIYYVWTFVALMVDQRAKNMFLTYWGSTGKWYPYFYDNDTCFGINNEGQLVFDYYHEDTDTLDGANVYNGQNSTLWCNFREAFADEIKETYQKLRGDGLITYDILEEQFITKGSDKWSESIFNEDSEFKYVSMVKSSNDASNLPFARGDGEQHFKYFIENRLNYCDSKWYAGGYISTHDPITGEIVDNFVSLRIYTPVDENGNPRTDLAIPANADITLVPYSNMYAGVRYKANGTLYQERVEHGDEITFEAPNETFNDTETAIYGANQLSSLGDLAPLYCGTVNVSKATKLTEIKIGDATEGYANNNLKELSVGTNKLLKKIDIQNCPSFTSALGLSGCQNIEEIYAKGSGITGVELADSGYLKIVQLPATIANLTIKNQEYLEEFSMEGYSALKTMQVENCPAIDTLSILDNATNLERVRLTGVDWEYDDASFLYELKARNLAGIDENGSNTDIMWLDGKCHIKTLTGNEMAEINAMFPYLTITYDNLTSKLIYMSEDGTTELYRETILAGGNGTCPVTSGKIEAPTKESTAQYDYSHAGWSTTSGGEADANALLKVEADRTVYAAFTSTIRSYKVNFYSGTLLLQSLTVEYGKNAVYSGSTPKHESGEDYYEFTGWKPEPTNIQGNTDCYAQFFDNRVIDDDWATIEANCNNGTATTKYAIGAYKPVEITYEDGTSETIDMEVIAHNHDELADGNYKWESVDTVPFNAPTNAVVLNNELHILGGEWSAKNHYKHNGTEWVSITTLPYSMFSPVVLNNEIYAIANESIYKFDGTEWSVVTAVPYTSPHSLVVFNGELHILGAGNQYAGNHYKWDGTEWTSVSSLPTRFYGSRPALVYDNAIHILSSAEATHKLKHYKWDGTTWSFVSDLPTDFTVCNNSSIVYDDAIHIFQSEHHYVFDGTEWKDLKGLPYNVGNFAVTVFNNEVHLFGGAKQHFKWSTASWEKVTYTNTGNIPGFNYNYSTKINDIVYMLVQNKKIYKFDGEEITHVIDCPSYTAFRGFGSYNGELYMATNMTNSETSEVYNSMFKLSGEEWIEIEMPTLDTNATFTAGLIEYKEKLHLLYGNKHYTYDGSEWTTISESLESTFHLYRGQCLIHNDCIYYMSYYYNNYLVKYDGKTYTCLASKLDTEDVIGNGQLIRFCSYNGKLYFGSMKKICVYDENNNKFTVLTETLSSPVGEGLMAVIKGRLYYGLGSRCNSTIMYIYKNPKATLTFFAKNLLKDSMTWNNTATGFNTCYKDCSLRTYLNGDFISTLPFDLQDIIKEVTKYRVGLLGSITDYEIVKSIEKCWIPSDDELGADTISFNIQGEGTAYNVFTDNASRKRTKNDGQYYRYFTASPYIASASASRVNTVDENGSLYLNYNGSREVHTKQAIVFGFCI